jgi:high-affinity Fe2+/Pb2+ permease
MFYLSESDITWTLSYEVSPMRRALMIAGGVAGLCVGMIFQTINSSASLVNWSSFMLPVILCLVVAGFWAMSDSATEATFDMAKNRIRVHSKRPLFGPARSFAFSDVAAIRAVNRSGETVDFMGSLHRVS